MEHLLVITGFVSMMANPIPMKSISAVEVAKNFCALLCIQLRYFEGTHR